MIAGVNHLMLSARNLEESCRFYTQVLGCRAVAKWPKGAYVLAGDVWLALVLDPHVRRDVLPEYTHIAFTVSPTDFTALSQRLVNAGATIWQQHWTEGESLYFTDPNGHKLEIHAADLAARIKSATEQPWEGLEFF